MPASQANTPPDPAVASVKHEALERSRHRILLAAHSWFAITSFCRFADVADLETIVTGTELPGDEAKSYEALGPRVLRTRTL